MLIQRHQPHNGSFVLRALAGVFICFIFYFFPRLNAKRSKRIIKQTKNTPANACSGNKSFVELFINQLSKSGLVTIHDKLKQKLPIR